MFSTILIFFLAALSVLMSFQGVLTLAWMLYVWNDPDKSDDYASPKTYEAPQISFTALVPARNEETVIRETILAIANAEYPVELREIFVICRSDDPKTIVVTKKVIEELPNQNVFLIIFEDTPINKPHALNIALEYARNDVVVVFDAEDQPHPDIFAIANTVMLRTKADVVQSGIQLMNYGSTWFSALNVLEYFFWFKSTLQFFSKIGVVPLGGNTIFVKTGLLRELGGWDETCLTEDAELGIRLSTAGAKIKTIYDEEHVTQEETPLTVLGFIKQRTRWNLGFMQLFFRGTWWKLPKLYQRAIAFYIFAFTFFQFFLFIYFPISLAIIFLTTLPIWLVILSIIPLYLLGLQVLVAILGMFHFTQSYGFKFTPWLVIKVCITFIPFQLLLGFSAARAFLRLLSHNEEWEKTAHTNAHRLQEYHTSLMPATLEVELG